MMIKPILFNTEMVRAILDGRKTCTRRVIKPQWEECTVCKYVHNEYIYDKMAENVYCARCGYPMEPERRSPYQIGDILYVRETWCGLPANEAGHLRGHPIYYYKADGDLRPEGWRGAWRPSIHMPKEAERIWLKVTDVRVERLHKITEEQARKEGCAGNFRCPSFGAAGKLSSQTIDCSIAKFKIIWDSTIKKNDLDRYGWQANPWVWVIEFERGEKPQEV